MEMEKGDTTLEQQSKVCMAEFKSRNCDALSPTPECLKLLPCIQRTDGTSVARVQKMMTTFFKELGEDFPYAFGLLVLFLMRQTNQALKDKEK